MIEEFSDIKFASDCHIARQKINAGVLVEHLGKGSLATVDLVAIYGLNYVTKSMTFSSEDEERLARIKNEVRGVSCLMRASQMEPSSSLFHPMYLAAVAIEEGDCSHERVVIVMAHEPEALTLYCLIRSGQLEEATARNIIRQVAVALGRLHQLGLCLVDLKPENVLVKHPSSPSPSVFLIDFDLSRPPDGPALKVEEKIFGTLEYLAPELILKTGTYSSASDWWALGVLTYECLYGHTPFAGDTLERTFFNISNRAPEFPPSGISFACTGFMRGLLRHKAEHRLGSKGGVNEVLSTSWLSVPD